MNLLTEKDVVEQETFIHKELTVKRLLYSGRSTILPKR
jgi:hypothetical protein